MHENRKLLEMIYFGKLQQLSEAKLEMVSRVLGPTLAAAIRRKQTSTAERGNCNEFDRNSRQRRIERGSQ